MTIRKRSGGETKDDGAPRRSESDVSGPHESPGGSDGN